MLGASRTVRAGRTIAHEFMQIREVEAGGLVYIAHPSGQREMPFPLLRLSAAEVVFENPGHDFPQRISYRLEQDGRPQPAIEGVHDDRLERIEFPMRRVSGEPAPAPHAGIKVPAKPR